MTVEDLADHVSMVLFIGDLGSCLSNGFSKGTGVITIMREL